VVLFPVYAALVWYGCFRWRRRFQGMIWLAAGMLGLAFLAWLDVVGTRWLLGRFPGPLFIMLLAAEAGIVGPVGLYVWSLRRERVDIPCRRCGYELKGLEVSDPTCPECGLPSAVPKFPGQVRAA
jgi:ribosomal protein L37E